MKKALKHSMAAAAMSMLVGYSAVRADDIEVYISYNKVAKPTVLFLLDESASMLINSEGSASGTKCTSTTRTDVLRESLLNVLNEDDFQNLKVGILGYGTNSQGWRPGQWAGGCNEPFPPSNPDDRSLKFRLISPFQDVGPNKTQLLNLVQTNVQERYTSYLTPTSKALEAAVEWFEQGYDSSRFTGNVSQAPNNCMQNIQKKNGDYNKYKLVCTQWWDVVGPGINTAKQVDDSPLKQKDGGDLLFCQNNNIILMTDGDPYLQGTEWVSQKEKTYYYIKSYKGKACDTTINNIFDSSGNKSKNIGGAVCSPEIAEYAFNTDFLDDSEGWLGKQNIKVHTIGFQTATWANNYLKYIAEKGGGIYRQANNSTDLVDAFFTILKDVSASIPVAYTAPSIPVNLENVAVSGNEIYIPLFEPSPRKHWRGNLKKYQVEYKNDNVVISAESGGMAPDNRAVDDNLEFISAQDYWNHTGSNDNAKPLNGGALSNMTASATRKLYTYLDSSSSKELTASENRVAVTNPAISLSLLDVNDEAERSELLHWINWELADKDEFSARMGAPLHTSPIRVEYSGDDLIFINTSDGILHAFNARTGQEEWAYMPDELLNYIKTLYDNKENVGPPRYGLDGPMTYYKWGNKKYLVFGMRRGGRNYYALDITAKLAPKFAWEIKGGVTSGFDKLGQTWSKPLLLKFWAKPFDGGTNEKQLLVFGGGYDDAQDPVHDVNGNLINGQRSDDSMGHAIYFVHPGTGALVKEISSSSFALDEGDMANGIVANLLPVDINANGLVDRLYAVDVGGRIIRIDIPDELLEKITGEYVMTGAVIADVNVFSDGSLQAADDTQRFYNTPEVAYFDRGGDRYLALLVGSGWRPDPLVSEVQDRFYMIKDYAIWTAPISTDANGNRIYGDYEMTLEAELYDASANLIQEGVKVDENGNNTCAVDPDIDYANNEGYQDCALKQLAKAKGWYIDLDEREKVFSRPRVYDYVVLFTSYQTSPPQIEDVCRAKAADSSAYLYAINMATGAAMFNVEGNEFDANDTDNLNKGDRRIDLGLNGMIPPSPVLLFPERKDDDGNIRLGGMVVAMVGLKKALEWSDRFHPISWEEVINETVNSDDD